MSVLAALLFFVVVTSSSCAGRVASSALPSRDEPRKSRSGGSSGDAAFAKFKREVDRVYPSPEEEAYRSSVFTENMRRAREMAVTNPFASFGMNEFADLTPAEFKAWHNAERYYAMEALRDEEEDPSPSVSSPTLLIMSEASRRLAAGKKQDWRPKGAVTPVKNQGQCGSCWAFSTTGNIEGQWFLAGHPLTSLSEQELVSCDTNNWGCDGGAMVSAYEWLQRKKHGEIVTESSYPYVSGRGNVPVCHMHHRKFGARIDGHRKLEHREDAMAAFVYEHGPLAVGVDATSWQTYTHGILTNCVSRTVDHGVLIVGFDDEHRPPYWIVKNSWAKSWGEHGYIRIEKGSDQCLIASSPSTSEVHKKRNETSG